MEVWPAIADVLATAPAPSPLVRTAADLLTAWRAAGGSRLDRDLDGRIDHPGAAVMDAAWPLIARAVMAGARRPRGAARPAARRVRQRKRTGLRVHRRLVRLRGEGPPRCSAVRSGPYSTRYCGGGDLDACRESLWAAITEASAKLTAKHTSDPATWWADARAERIDFTTGLLSDTLAWTNRPTFQQVMSFGHRPR